MVSVASHQEGLSISHSTQFSFAYYADEQIYAQEMQHVPQYAY